MGALSGGKHKCSYCGKHFQAWKPKGGVFSKYCSQKCMNEAGASESDAAASATAAAGVAAGAAAAGAGIAAAGAGKLVEAIDGHMDGHQKRMQASTDRMRSRMREDAEIEAAATGQSVEAVLFRKQQQQKMLMIIFGAIIGVVALCMMAYTFLVIIPQNKAKVAESEARGTEEVQKAARQGKRGAPAGSATGAAGKGKADDRPAKRKKPRGKKK